jgi:5-methylcytosine-specific restriction endonuclease McrA
VTISATKPPKRNNTLRIADTTADAAKRKAKRTAARRKAKRAMGAEAVREWSLTCEAIYRRDAGRCRVCRTIAAAFSPASVHHIRYRSAGGTDATENLILLCQNCHNDEHEHRIRITGTADDLRIER